MTATYTFDIFCSLDGFGSYGEGATGVATGASKALSFSIAAWPFTNRSSGSCSGRTPIGNS